MANPTHNMIARPKYKALVFVGLVQTLVLTTAWAFFAAVRASDPLHLSDSAAHWVHDNPTETTLIVTILATFLSVVTGICFSFAVKQALTQRVAKKPMSLVELSAGVAFAKNSFVLKRAYVLLTIKTLAVFGAFTLLTSNWTTLLTPVQVTLLVEMSGWELDISSSNFDQSLQQALAVSTSSLEWIQVFESSGLLADIAAAGNSSGLDSIFNFNDVKYNVSTGGILPAVVSYNGTQRAAPAENSGIYFSGGLVPANLTANQGLRGISSTFTVQQQGFAADVICGEYTNPADWGGLEVGQASASGTLVNVSIAVWALETLCPNNGGTSQQAFVIIDTGGGGLLSSVVCPAINTIANPNIGSTFNQISVYSNGTGLTSNKILLSFLASGIGYLAWQTQSVATNTLGDALISIYTATTTSNTSNVDPTQILQELAQFWRGVVEFSGTYVRSGFSAYPRTVSSDMLASVQGTQMITTMGWTAVKPTYLYTLIPVTLTAFLTYIAIFICLRHALEPERDDVEGIKSGTDANGEPPVDNTEFDITNPIHLVIASAAEKLKPGSDQSDHWQKYEASNVRLEGARLKGT
ncbi:hypothetical protein BS17DRAFT_823283 [Gyrodon lividus]|nr:hypothetical protein BS17DRAFT_823283 [Gyrodon lividus]